MTLDIGFMQGRLSKPVNGKIQAFPKETWQKEFPIAEDIGFRKMEWTLDFEGIFQNPLMTTQGREKINQLKDKYSISIPSLTGDCFMQKPFWKKKNQESKGLKKLFLQVIENCSLLDIKYIVVPIVDNGSIDSIDEEEIIIDFLNTNKLIFEKLGLQILFESDLKPERFKLFMRNFDPDIFGINYDIGNSASLDYDVREEFDAYGELVKNVHVKDRKLFGETVPLMHGNANFELVFKTLIKNNYSGNLILQTARCKDGNHAYTLSKYRQITKNLILKYS